MAACHHTPDDEQVRQSIAAVASDAEAGHAGGVTGLLSNDFDGNAGELDRPSLGNMIRLLHLRGEKIGVTAGPVSIEHRGKRIVASFRATLVSGGHILPDHLGVYAVETAWRKDDGSWRCYRASWKQEL